ncbi:hypothetical protein ACEZCY_18840 [Streptacidiphilus sp. N1-12]|uniref:Uncharacterized protein n=2 Tax=Streptacidiphilus alkalitolerans TaxID=3342712 RepID=A0ABV6VBZ0_9ACTN
MGLVDRLQDRIAHAEGMARCLPERGDDEAVRPPGDQCRFVGRVSSQTAFDPSWLHQDRQAAPVDGPELRGQDEEGVSHHLFLLVQQPEAVTIEVRLSRPGKMEVETQGVGGQDLCLGRDADRQLWRTQR